MKKKDFVVDKYSRRRFCQLHPLHNDADALNEVKIDILGNFLSLKNSHYVTNEIKICVPTIVTKF